MTLASKIAKNTTYLSVSSVIQKLLAFGFYIYVAAQLGVDLLGQYSFALSYTGIFVIIMNFGFVPILTREGAKDHTRLKEHFEFILSLKVIFAVVGTAVLIGTLHFLNFYDNESLSPYAIQLVYLATVVILLDTFRSVFLAVLRATQQMHYEAIGQILYQLIVVGVGSLVLFFGFKAIGLMLVLILASVVYFGYTAYAVVRYAGIKPRFAWKKDEAWKAIKIAAPFAMADIFFKLNGSIDTVMLQFIAGERYVAWYNIALKLTVTLTIIPGAFATAFFPAMSRAFHESIDQLRIIFEDAFNYLLILSVPVAVGTYLIADDIIALAFPDFPAAVRPLQLFMASVVFLFANYPIGSLLNASNKQLLNTANMAIALVINILINIWLIPQYTYMGATLSAVVSSIVLVLLGLPHVYRIIHFQVWNMLGRAIRILGAALVMAAALYTMPQVHVLVSVTLGALVYVLALFILRVITVREVAQLLGTLRNRF